MDNTATDPTTTNESLDLLSTTDTVTTTHEARHIETRDREPTTAVKTTLSEQGEASTTATSDAAETTTTVRTSTTPSVDEASLTTNASTYPTEGTTSTPTISANSEKVAIGTASTVELTDSTVDTSTIKTGLNLIPSSFQEWRRFLIQLDIRLLVPFPNFLFLRHSFISLTYLYFDHSALTNYILTLTNYMVLSLIISFYSPFYDVIVGMVCTVFYK